jgi:hypothetical protein
MWRVWGKRRSAHWVVVGISEGNKQPERPRRRWEDHIIMDIKDVG